MGGLALAGGFRCLSALSLFGLIVREGSVNLHEHPHGSTPHFIGDVVVIPIIIRAAIDVFEVVNQKISLLAKVAYPTVQAVHDKVLLAKDGPQGLPLHLRPYRRLDTRQGG
jgi:hypothetical protein